MKITADRKQLADTLAWVAQVCPRNPSTPVLSGIKIVAGLDGIEVSAFDYETYHAATVPAIVHDDGAAVVPGAMLRDIAAAAVTDDLDLVLEGTRLVVKSGRATYAVPTLVLEDYPRAPVLPPAVGTLPVDDLARLVGNVAQCASTDPSQPKITCVHLVTDDGDTLRAEATDRYSAAVDTLPWTGDHFEALLPARSIVAALKGLVGDAQILADGPTFAIRTDGRTISTRGSGEQYLDIERLFRPLRDDVHVLECPGDALRAALRRLRVVGDAKQPRVEIVADDAGLALNEADSQGGTEYVDATVTEPISFLIDPARLDDLLPVGTVRLGLVAPTRPVTVHDPERPDLRQLIMPVKPGYKG